LSKRKNRERANQFIYRNGTKIPRASWDKYQKELREVVEAERLAKLGLVRAKSNILTPEEVLKERRATHGKNLHRIR